MKSTFTPSYRANFTSVDNKKVEPLAYVGINTVLYIPKQSTAINTNTTVDTKPPYGSTLQYVCLRCHHLGSLRRMKRKCLWQYSTSTLQLTKKLVDFFFVPYFGLLLKDPSYLIRPPRTVATYAAAPTMGAKTTS